MTDREIDLHTARVLLSECRKRRASGRSHAVLLQWAINARRRAMVKPEPAQPDLFGGMNR
jgi:hypothetical protein